MQTAYAQKNETTQRAADNTAAAVHDNSPQSESLQRHASLANAAVQRAENPPRPNNTGLPDDLKNGVESLSGYSLDNVRVHYNSPKPATVQALAYTQGTDIHVAPGQEHALPHEAWHVTQQMAGRVTPTTNIGGMPVNDNAALEHEADVMGEKAVQRKGEGNEVEKNFSRGKISDISQRKVAQLMSVGVSYRTDGRGEPHFSYDRKAIEEAGKMVREDGGVLSENEEVNIVSLPKNFKLDVGYGDNAGPEKCERIQNESDLDDIDLIYIPGNPHAIDDQIDDNEKKHKGSGLKKTEEITHRFDVDYATEGKKVRFQDKNAEYIDRSSYEQWLIGQAEKRKIPVMAVCGGSWQLLSYFGGATFVLPPDQYEVHANKMSNNSAHSITPREGSKLFELLGNNPVNVNSTHWASALNAWEQPAGYEMRLLFDELTDVDKLFKNVWEQPAGYEMRLLFDELTDVDKCFKSQNIVDYLNLSAVDADDGNVEAFESKDGLMMGFQWHPETFLPNMKGYESLIKECDSAMNDEEKNAAQKDAARTIESSKKIFRHMFTLAKEHEEHEEQKGMAALVDFLEAF